MRDYQQCTRCIMDTSDVDIAFDADGVCNHCFSYDEQKLVRLVPDNVMDTALAELVQQIKKSGKGKDYDCIIGVSGGVDSTYVAYLTKELGLRPLAIHFDNGWNSELAVSNIEKTLNILDIDLFTYVIDWNQFKSLQLSFLKASTPDGEIPTDHAINALLFKEARKRGLKYIINGMNFRTEPSFNLPKWAYGHADWKYIKSVHKRQENTSLSKYPHYSLFDTFYFMFVRGIKLVSILNYIKFDKNEAMDLIQNKLDWKYYGGKHYESVYTRFYQGYILPKKFNIDKRRAHLSALILSDQLERKEALSLMDEPIMDPELVKRDYEFVLKKLGIDAEEFERIMNLPAKSFEDYPNNSKLVWKLKKVHNKLRATGKLSK